MVVANAPYNLVAISSDGKVFLNWTIPNDNGDVITDYTIQYSIDGSTWNTFVHSASTNNYIDVTSLINDQVYFFKIAAVNGSGTSSYSSVKSAIPTSEDIPEYCSVDDVANWLRIDITPNSDPNISNVKSYIAMNEDSIDRKTGHSWKSNKTYYNEVFNVSDVYDWGQGMYLPLKHRGIKTFNTALGDKFEIWDGVKWVEQTISDGLDSLIVIEPTQGILYIRGYVYTSLRKNRFRLTYRYGGEQEGTGIPKDIKKCCILMTAIDIVSTDFKFSQLAFGGEGNVKKENIILNWQEQINGIIKDHSDILTVW